MGKVYSLVAEERDTEGKAFEVKIEPFALPEGQTLNFQYIKVSGADDRAVRLSGETGGSIAYERLRKKGLVHKTSEIPNDGVVFYFNDCPPDRIKGPSAGLCFLVKMAQEIIEDFLKRKTANSRSYDFAATGEIKNLDSGGEILAVGFIEKKIRAALTVLGDGGTVFYPKANAPLDPDLHQQATRKQIALVVVDTPQQVIDFLCEKYGIRLEESDGGDRWPIFVLLLCLTVMIMGDKPLPVPSKPPCFMKGQRVRLYNFLKENY